MGCNTVVHKHYNLMAVANISNPVNIFSENLENSSKIEFPNGNKKFILEDIPEMYLFRLNSRSSQAYSCFWGHIYSRSESCQLFTTSKDGGYLIATAAFKSENEAIEKLNMFEDRHRHIQEMLVDSKEGAKIISRVLLFPDQTQLVQFHRFIRITLYIGT